VASGNADWQNGFALTFCPGIWSAAIHRRFWWAKKHQCVGAFSRTKSGDESPHSKKPVPGILEDALNRRQDEETG